MGDVSVRLSLFKKIKKIRDQAINHSVKPLSELEVCELLVRVNRQMQALETVHYKLVGLCTADADVDVQDTIYEPMEEAYLAARLKLLEIQASQQQANPTSSVGGSGTSAASRVKLPRIELPKFTGRYEDWISFKDLFFATVHNDADLTGAQKLQYLKSVLDDEPATLIRSLQVSNSNYQEAWDLLNNRYDNTREIVNSVLQRLFGLKPIQNESAVELQKLLDNSKECVRTLKVLKRPVEHWDDVLIYFYLKKLDSNTRREWAIRLTGSTIPTFTELTDFLENHIRGLQASGSINQKPSSVGKRQHQVAAHHASSSSSSSDKCVICSGSHNIYSCRDFLSKSPAERSNIVKQHRMCYNCLQTGHPIKMCRSNSKCKKCQKRHHTMLHVDRIGGNEANKENSAPPTPENISSNHALQVNTQVLLPTAVVLVKDSTGVNQKCRVLLDTGSQGSFISEDCVHRLGLRRQRCNVQITGVSASSTITARGLVQLSLTSLYENVSVNIEAMILSKVTSMLPKHSCTIEELKHIQGIQLADPSFHQPGQIDILVGADYVSTIIQEGIRSGPPNTPSAQKSIFGWIIMGRVQQGALPTIQANYAEIDVDEILQKFWEVEEPPQIKHLTNEEKQCEENFATTVRRDLDGKFIVRLPFNSKKDEIGESKQAAIRRLKQVERRLDRNPEWRDEYNKFMDEYESLGHMEKANESSSHKGYYLPHHFVVNTSSTTTKFRVVFDGSAKSSTGTSLNDALMIGPPVQAELYSILLRFRTYVVVIKGDISKMYRQFKVDHEDCHYQKIVWRKSPSDPIQEYVLLTVTYGTSCAPYLATKCVQTLGIDNRANHPEAAKTLEEETYVDDVMSGANSTTEAIHLYKELNTVVSTAGLQLRKWCSNDEEVLCQIPAEDRETELSLGLDRSCIIKALGIKWNPSSDTFTFIVPEYDSNHSVLTKRALLSRLAQVFDPLGFISAVTLRAKILLQQLWKIAVGWDDPLPVDIQEQWKEYKEDLGNIDQLHIPRCITSSTAIRYELHGFSDASEMAYGAVVYLKAVDKDNNVQIGFITSKSKVSPLKQITLPRLELCAAVVLSKLMSYMRNSLKLCYDEYCWTDSTIVLRWISASPKKWKNYIANRVAVIQTNTSVESWRHVPGIHNPADIASRGCAAADLISNTMWWKGPDWLQSVAVPIFIPNDFNSNVDAEERKVNFITTLNITIEKQFMDNISSFTKLKRTTAFCMRFIHNSRKLQPNLSGPLSALEIRQAYHVLIKIVQRSSFRSEIKALHSLQPVSVNSKLKTLHPFLDNEGILRVGGRLRNADLPEQKKHQIILPHDNHLTQLLIKHTHVSLLHGGFQVTWCALQAEYWILRGRDTVRFHIRKCIICRRHQAKSAAQLMGNLPSSRLTITRPFLNVGVDYAGPFMLRNMVGRSSKIYKGYMAIFVCMATKAVHMEAVSDLSTEAFIASLRRLVARRGLCANIHSDNGTNFVGADAELKRLFSTADHNNKVADFLSSQRIMWQFIPPSAPHHGGIWEAAVKSAKFHLKRVLGNSLCTFEKFQTILTQVEAVMNSRPLCPLSSDPTDLNALTPGHFIIGEPLTALPDEDLVPLKTNRLSMWQQLQQRMQHFWQRWRDEYLVTLQQRHKWFRKEQNINEGDLVLIKEDNSPPGKWKLARVTKVHPGKDGSVRVATVKTATSEYDRPIVKLIPLLSQ